VGHEEAGMQKVATQRASVKWKDEFVSLRVHRSDRGPQARALEIAVVLFRRRQPTWRHRQLIQLPEEVELHQPWVAGPLEGSGINPADLPGAPPFENVLRGLLAGLCVPAIVGHYLDDDFKILGRERAIAEQRLGFSLAECVPRPKLTISICHLSRKFHPVLGDDLEAMCRHYDLPKPSADNLQRAELAGNVFVSMCDTLPESINAMRAVLKSAKEVRRRSTSPDRVKNYRSNHRGR
jgi:hypothetical protein